VHVVLLHLRDDLYQDALSGLCAVVPRLYGSRIRLWTCHVHTPDDAALIQACRFPQYRIIVNGIEKTSHVGVLGERELLDKIYTAEES
jgi:hypothetical protein